MQDDDIKMLTGLQLSIHRALWGAVIPSLRLVRLEWNPGDHTALIIFYHDGAINDAITENYSCVHSEVVADFFVHTKVDFKITRCDDPNPLPKEHPTIYLRKEPFEDPK